MSKTLFYTVEDNTDLSNTVRTIEDASELIQIWMSEKTQQELLEEQICFTIQPVWMTEEEYEALCE